MITKRLHFIVILIAIIISGCLLHPSTDLYVDGMIHMTFKEGVNQSQAEDLIHSYNVSIEYVGVTYNGWICMEVRVPEGEEDEYVEMFEKEDIIYVVGKERNPPE